MFGRKWALRLPDGVVVDGAVAGDYFGHSVSGNIDLIIGSPNRQEKQQQ